MDRDKLKRLFNEFFGDDKGALVLKEIKNICGFDKSTLSYTDGEVNENAFLVREGQRTVWIKIEQLLSEETKKNIHLI